MEWTEKLTTGVPLLDSQHQTLVAAVNELQQAAASGGIMPTMYAMDQLRDYMKSHFTCEEELMRKHNFPGLEAHMAEHRAFAVRLHQLMVANVHHDNTAELVSFLTEWLAHHLSGSDMAYVPYLAGNAGR